MSSTSHWAQSPIEKIAYEKVLHLHDGSDIWSRYELTRTDIGSNILPYVASQEPGLSDHGTAHIANVMENVGRILGLRRDGELEPDCYLEKIATPELLLLLLGALLHDIGNIAGRDRHNQVTENIWRKAGQNSYKLWKNPDRKAVIALCQAHTGKSEIGSSDTLKPLMASTYYFLDGAVEMARLAAILRFADELAEGQQRTSRYLLLQKKYDPDLNEVYHHYANCTDLTIDRPGKRIALYFSIDLDEIGEGDMGAQQVTNLIDLIFKRVIKLDNERLFARAYAGDWLPFNETSVVLELIKGGERVIELPPITLNDFNLRTSGSFELRDINEVYNVAKLVERVRPHLGSN